MGVTPTDTLAGLCGETASIARAAVDWFDANPDKPAQERASLNRELRKMAAAAGQLERSLDRPMCVGVFGPSQAGKSYLISALARRGDRPLMARFAGHRDSLDFVRDLNPEGGQESTGLVTRFTLRSAATPGGFPVMVRLLSQTDLIKILGNTYLSDIDPSEAAVPGAEAVLARLDAAAAEAEGTPVDPLSADDVFDLQEYFETHFKGVPVVQALGGAFWSRAAELAPRLALDGRLRLLGVLWGDLAPFSELYRTLYQALRRLGFAGTAFCPMDSLLPRETSIIDVRTLGGLTGAAGHPAEASLPVRGDNGGEARLERAVLTALVAELNIVIRDPPWPFLEHTDLLDFPGARSRESIQDAERHLSRPGELQSLFLRGKVAFLFDRYVAEQDLSSMLLCIGPSNQEVRTLPRMIRDWVEATHGPDPEARRRNRTALFLVLTKFDAEFEDKAGQAETSEARWSTRLRTAITDYLGKAGDWTEQWHPGRAFDNTYWIRNPNYKAKHLLDYTADGAELGVRASEQERVDRFRREYLANDLVRKHFADPERAWDEAFRRDDGGITYLAEQLEPVCRPEIKRRQIAERLSLLRGAMQRLLRRFHHAGDLAAQRADREKAARRVVRHLAVCAEQQRFGQLLHVLQVSDATLADCFQEVQAMADETGKPAAVGRTAEARTLLTAMFGEAEDGEAEDDEAKPGEPEPGGTPEGRPEAPRDLAERFAGAVLRLWMGEAHALARQDRLVRYFCLTERSALDLVAELIAGARRLDIETAIAERVRRITSFRQTLEKAAARPALVAANILNDYLNTLGYGDRPEAERPASRLDGRPVFSPRTEASGDRGRLQLPEVPDRYDERQYLDWFSAYLALVEANATSQDGQVIDVAANDRLGRLVHALDASARDAA